MRDEELEASVDLGAGVAAVLCDQRSRVVRSDDDDRPLAGQRVVLSEVRTSHADSRVGRHPDAERPNQRAMQTELLVASLRRVRESFSRLERGKNHEIAILESEGFEMARHSQEHLLGADAFAVGPDHQRRRRFDRRSRDRQRDRRWARWIETQRTGATEIPTLAERGAERLGLLEMLGRLDALGENGRSRRFGMREYRGHDPALLDSGLVLNERDIELDDVGRDKGQDRQRIGLGTNVVQRNSAAVRSSPTDDPQYLARIA